MAFLRSLTQAFQHGSNLVAAPDQIPEGGLRLLVNARLTRALGRITNRAGMSVMTAAAIAADVSVHALMTLFRSAANARYAHVGTTLYRLTTAWLDPVELETSIGEEPASSASMVDGEGDIYTYFTNTTGLTPCKDNGTLHQRWGVPAMTEAVPLAELATDLSTSIDVMDTAANWTVTSGLTAGPTDETNIKQQGTGSVTITVAASTLGRIAKSLGGTVDLDVLTGGDAEVKIDDYIHVHVRADFPERIQYLQIDLDLDTTTVANAFRNNFYSVQLAGTTWLEQGAGQWSTVQVAKSRFSRAGTDTTLSWATCKSIRLSVQTNGDGPCQVYFDDLKLRGGTDIVGEVRYAAVYRNSVTGGRGNPRLNSEGAVGYAAALKVDRQRVNVTITNIRNGGAAFPNDTQINQIRLYRSIDEGEAIQIAQFAATTASPYLDSISIASTLLADTLETDNGMPPEAHIVFGPGALNRLFALVGVNDLYFSKSWEVNENRADNWPPLFRAKIGDGSERAQTGLISDTTPLVWTDQQEYALQGSGEDTFLPMVVPNSRGAVGRQAVTSGDGKVFFVSQDGIYEQVGLQAKCITSAIAPFFAGLTVLGQLGWNTSPTAQRTVRLAWHADALGPFLLMLYPAGTSLTPRHELYLGRDPQTGQYSHISFDERGGIPALTALHSDHEQNVLFGGATNGHVYRLEHTAVDTDNDQAIPFRVVTRSETFNAPHRDKYVTQAQVQADTNGQELTATALYDHQETAEDLAPLITTTQATAMVGCLVDQPETFHRDVGLELNGRVTERVEISHYGWWYEVQPEVLTFWDSGQVALDAQAIMQGLWYTLLSTAPVVVTVYCNEAFRASYTIVSTIGIRIADRVFFAPGTKGRDVRITLSSTEGFRLYALDLRSKPYGTAQGYQSRSLLGTGGQRD